MAGNAPGRALGTRRGVENKQTRYIVHHRTPCDTPTITAAQPPRLPPYGRQLLEQGPTPADELRIYFGTDEREIWNHARRRNVYAPPALVLLPGNHAESFRWPVAGWSVFAIQIGAYEVNEIPALARLLLEGGASIVRVLYGENPDLTIYRPVYEEVAA
jgi:hypothetical protein